jgi:hypothetical protein
MSRLVRLIACFGTSILLSGCQTSAQRVTASPQLPRLAPMNEVRYGNPRFPALLCTNHYDYGTCKRVTSGRITVVSTDVHPNRDNGGEYFEVKTGSLEGGLFIRDLDWITLRSEEDQRQAVSAQKDCDRRGGVRVGMSKDDVIKSCWGQPTRVNKTTTAAGTTEQWVFGRSYVYFNAAGQVYAVQH